MWFSVPLTPAHRAQPAALQTQASGGSRAGRLWNSLEKRGWWPCIPWNNMVMPGVLILCGFLGHVQWSNHVLRGTFWLLLFRAVNVGTHGAESHTACNLERLNKLLVNLRGLPQNLCKCNATWRGFTYWISKVNKNKQNKILDCVLTCP